jgi:DNA invertase Pin-like site-specific DNA recombinase
MIQVYAYSRVSGVGQADGDGPERQLVAIRRWCHARKGEIAHHYSDTITGKSELANRPQLQQLRDDMIAGDVKVVVIERLDRLARDLMIQEAIIKDFQRNGLTIFSTMEEDLCSTDPTRKLIRQILGAFADYERQMIVDKLASARARKQARGELIYGRAPYGWKKVTRAGKVSLEEDNFEQAILARIWEWRAQGYGYVQIANKLNEQNIPTRDHKQWYSGTVDKVLKRKVAA